MFYRPSVSRILNFFVDYLILFDVKNISPITKSDKYTRKDKYK